MVGYFGKCFSFLQYCSILGSIPRLWKVQLHSYNFSEPLDEEDCIERLSKGQLSASKKIYWFLIEKRFSDSDSYRIIWEKNLKVQLSQNEWTSLFPDFLKWVKPTKLRSFQYNVLTNSLTTNVKRNKWNKDISDRCAFCQDQKETVTHLLYQCKFILPLWQAFEKMIQRLLKIQHTFSMKTICLNDYYGRQKELINLLMVIMKQYIYASKCLGETPTFLNYMGKVSKWYNYDMLYAQDCDKESKCKKKWKDIYY